MKTATLVCLVVAAPMAAQTIPNGTFDDDLSGWDVPPFPDTVIAWDFFGNPEGSMRIESSWNPPPTVVGIPVLTSDCFDLPVGNYSLEVDYFGQSLSGGGALCALEYYRYVGAGCPWSPSGGSSTDGTSGSWRSLTVGFDVFDGVARSWRIGLSMVKAPGAETAVCHFDNLRLIGPPPSTLEIPTLGDVGLLLVAALLAGVGVVALRTSRRNRLLRSLPPLAP